MVFMVCTLTVWVTKAEVRRASMDRWWVPSNSAQSAHLVHDLTCANSIGSGSLSPRAAAERPLDMDLLLLLLLCPIPEGSSAARERFCCCGDGTLDWLVVSKWKSWVLMKSSSGEVIFSEAPALSAAYPAMKLRLLWRRPSSDRLAAG